MAQTGKLDAPKPKAVVPELLRILLWAPTFFTGLRTMGPYLGGAS